MCSDAQLQGLESRARSRDRMHDRHEALGTDASDSAGKLHRVFVYPHADLGTETLRTGR